jgi:hypothetical protein
MPVARCAHVTAQPSLAADQLSYERVDPLAHAADIKRLFLEHERPEFPAFFDRTYPEAVAAGAQSWIGRDAEGRIQAHVAQLPRRFLLGERQLAAALMVNLMVATAYRRYWPAVGLVRRAIADMRRSGSFDFTYADPNDAAQPITRGAGFRPVGVVRRFVLPLGDRRPAVALGIGLYRSLVRVLGRGPRLACVEQPARHVTGGTFPGPGTGSSLRPIRSLAVYRSRLAGYPADDDRWFVFRDLAASSDPAGRVLVRGPDERGVAVVCAWECGPLAALRSMLVAVTDRLRRLGAARLELCVVTGSPAERAVRRAGFLPRPEFIPLLAVSFSEAGAAAVEKAPDWRVLPVDLDR